MEHKDGSHTRSRKSIFISAIMMLVLILAAGWYWTRFDGDDAVSQSIRQSRIAILPFENKTNDPSLDMLGDMAADWIIQGLMNLDEVKVVSYQTIKDNIQYASVGSAGSGSDFAERTGAEKIVRGRIYKQDERLIVQTNITDAITGEMEIALPEIRGLASDLQGLVDQLRNRMMSKFALNTSNDYQPGLEANPPNFEAFKYNNQAGYYFGADYPKCRELLSKAISMDSNYVWPYISMAFTYGNEGLGGKVDSILNEVARRFPNLSFNEKNYVGFIRENLLGNRQAAYGHLKNAFEKDPKNFLNCYLTGLSALMLNRPEEAIGYFDNIDPAGIEISRPSSTWWHFYYARALVRLGRLDDAMKILSYVPYEKADNGIFTTKALVYMLRDQQDSIMAMVSRLKELALSGNPVTLTYNAVANKYAVRKDPTNQLIWANRSLEYLKSIPKAEKDASWAFSLYLAGKFQEALKVYEDIHKKNPQWSALSRIGCLNAKLGRKDIALMKIKELEQMNLPYPEGRISYGIARIYVGLGEKEKSFNMLVQAFREGYGFDFNAYDYDFELLPLFDYPPFQEFVKPKG